MPRVFKPKSRRVLYRYSPLNKELNDIRLITLHPGAFASDLYISLQTVSLTPESPPIYEALSYAWGSTKNMTSIRIGENRLAVTKNLAEAMRHLRYSENPRTLWIDAICVNQQDLRERGHQVKRMADLYSLADRIVVWLGPEKSNSGLGMKIIEHMSSQLEVDWKNNEMKPASRKSESHWSNTNQAMPFSKEERLGINDVLTRPWFERLWVQQEIRLANRHAFAMCGSAIIAWESLRKTMFCLYHKRFSPIMDDLNLESLRECITRNYYLCMDSSTLSFLDIMERTDNCKCVDPRDRIYAVLSVIEKFERTSLIEPDYTKKVGQVYQDVTLEYIAHKRSIKILRSPRLGKKPSRIPTWVPDWRVKIKTMLSLGMLASGATLSEAHFKDPGILNVTGTCVAFVQHRETLTSNTDEELIASIRKNAPDDILESSYVGGGSLFAAYCHTLCAGHYAEIFIPPRKSWPRAQQSLNFLSAVLQPGEQRLQEQDFDIKEANTFLSMVPNFVEHYSFIKTREDYIGLAPLEALPGDHICILLGCDTPICLRSAPNHQFRLVGDCYVHGFMKGEGLLGPLPNHYQLVRVMDQVQSYKLQFYNHQTGKCQSDDPRFEPAPGDGVQILTPEMIEERGVKLRTFDLI